MPKNILSKKSKSKSNNGNKKSIKPTNNILTSKNDSKKRPVQPQQELEFVYYSEQVKTSRYLHEHEFINHICKETRNDTDTHLHKFKDDLKKLMEYTDFNENIPFNKRLREIFLLYVDQKDMESVENLPYKARIRDSFGESTALRVFFYKDISQMKYKVFLIDPHHLVIPSERQRKEKTYDKYKGKNLCISTLFK